MRRIVKDPDKKEVYHDVLDDVKLGTWFKIDEELAYVDLQLGMIFTSNKIMTQYITILLGGKQ